MKQLLPFLLLTLCYACGTPSMEEIPYTIIKGKVTRFVPNNRISVDGKGSDIIDQERRKISIITNAIRSGFNVPNHNGLLDEDGNFHFILKIETPTEIQLQHSFKNIPLYVTPGDNITVDIDFREEGNPHTISGDNTELNQKISAYYQLFRDSFRVELNATLPYVIPREFKTQRRKITERIRKVTEKYIQEEASDNPILANWVKNHSEYRIAMDYMKYAFKTYGISGFGGYSPDLKEGFSEHYFDFLEEFPVNNPSAITSLNYQNYLHFYRNYILAKLRKTSPYQDCVNLPTCNEFEMEVTQLSNALKGKAKDLSLSQQADYHLIRNNDTFLKNGFSMYLVEITDSIIIKDLLARKELLYEERNFEFPKNARLIQTDASGKEILSNIIEQNPTNNTLLYFWNTQREIAWFFERKSQLQDVWKKMDSLDIKLVLLAHHSTPNVWKEKIEELGLIGDLWHLTDEQFSFFKDYFLDNRKPHFNYDKIYDRENFLLLIDKNQDLNTIDNISFRESSFTWLNNLPWEFKSMMKKQRKAQIKVGAQ